MRITRMERDEDTGTANVISVEQLMLLTLHHTTPDCDSLMSTANYSVG